jgi:hypothetical protein
VVVGALALALAAHWRYMLLVKFDYGWNMQFCTALGVASAAGWLAFVTATRHPARGTMYAFLLLCHAALLLELLDFPPVLGLLDAHACWHAATVPLTVLFYRFVERTASGWRPVVPPRPRL